MSKSLHKGSLRPAFRIARILVLVINLALVGLLVGAVPAFAANNGAPVCPDGKNAVTGFHDLFNNTTASPGLQGVQPGDHVKVTFTVAPGCTEVEVSLASYRAPNDDFANNKTQQVLSDSATGFFDAGEHSLEIDVANCFFQADFAVGHVIQDLGRPEYYGPRLIDSATGGTTCVESSPSPSPTGSIEASSSPSVPASDAPTSSPTQGVRAATNVLPAAGSGTDLATGLVALLMVLTGIAVLAETRRRGILSMAVVAPRTPGPTGGGASAKPVAQPTTVADPVVAEAVAAGDNVTQEPPRRWHP